MLVRLANREDLIWVQSDLQGLGIMGFERKNILYNFLYYIFSLKNHDTF